MAGPAEGSGVARGASGASPLGLNVQESLYEGDEDLDDLEDDDDS